MPLERSTGKVKVDLNRIAFQMKDTATGAMVDCRVSEDALRKLSVGGSSIISLEDMFEKHRDRIEDLVSHKYDLGHNPPQVTAEDV